MFCMDKSNPLSVPSWKQFHSVLTSETGQTVSCVAFNPIIMAPPTDLGTVYTTLLRLKETEGMLGQEHIQVFFDMGLLTKALEITWSRPNELKSVIPCEGGMHLLMSVSSAVGFLYGDAGLKCLLHELGFFAAGTVKMRHVGKDFDMAMYGLKLVDEALHTRFYRHFLIWCERSENKISEELMALVERLANSLSEGETTETEQCISDLKSEIVSNLQPLLDEFRREGRSVSPTFRVWNDFLTRVLRPIKMFISATRKGCWSVHQETKMQLLPFLFATNHTNYAHYLTVSLFLMKLLPAEVLNSFQASHFVAKLSSGKFNSVWLDCTIEATENKALKGSGGIIGLTLKGSALVRWFMVMPITS